MGHGYNKNKRLRHQTVDSALCPHCGVLDKQAHIMTECPHPLLLPIRSKAKEQQHRIATALKAKHKSPIIKYFIEQFTHASWTDPSTQTRCIWTGMWTLATLRALLHPDIQTTSPMTAPERYQYRSIVRDLTAPLIDAYKQMILLQLPSRQNIARNTTNPIPLTTKRHMRLLFHHNNTSNVLPCMHTYPNTDSPSTFTYSDAAFSLTDVDVGILHVPVTF